jgi:uncharacterized membrane protein
MTAGTSNAARWSATVAVIAAGIWLGGLFVLGAIVAPTVFKIVDAPASANAMTLVFRRFDKVAMVCAGVILACEGWRVAARERLDAIAGGRIAAVVVAAALVVYQGLVLSPRIEALHRAGAVRGSGDLGLQLEAVHKVAETVAKLELPMLLAIIALHVVVLGADRRR